MQKVQSIVFDKTNFTLEKAANWVVANNFKIKKVDSTKNTFRFRQFPPNQLRKEGYAKYKTVPITSDINFIIAFKEKSN
jgi:hypothetical protein